MYKFSGKLKMLAIVLMALGLIGTVWSFYSAPKTLEEAKEILAKQHDAHGADHSVADSHETTAVAHVEEAKAEAHGEEENHVEKVTEENVVEENKEEINSSENTDLNEESPVIVNSSKQEVDKIRQEEASSKEVTKAEESAAKKSKKSIDKKVETKKPSKEQQVFRGTIRANVTKGLAPLDVMFDVEGENIVSYLWDFGDNTTTTNEEAPFHTFYEPGKYKVELTIIDKNANPKTLIKIIDVESSTKSSLGFIQNSFSPNGDGTNDVYKLEAAKNIKTFNARVMDGKTGKVIFGTTVTIVNVETDAEVTYQIVGDDEADVKLKKISYASPIAKAIIGKVHRFKPYMEDRFLVNKIRTFALWPDTMHFSNSIAASSISGDDSATSNIASKNTVSGSPSIHLTQHGLPPSKSQSGLE